MKKNINKEAKRILHMLQYTKGINLASVSYNLKIKIKWKKFLDCIE